MAVALFGKGTFFDPLDFSKSKTPEPPKDTAPKPLKGKVAIALEEARAEVAKQTKPAASTFNGWNPAPVQEKDPYEHYEILAKQVRTDGGKAHFIGEKARFLEKYDKNYVEALKHYKRALQYARLDPLSSLHQGVKYYNTKVLELAAVL